MTPPGGDQSTAPVAAAVLDEQEPVGPLDHRSPDQPGPHRRQSGRSLARSGSLSWRRPRVGARGPWGRRRPRWHRRRGAASPAARCRTPASRARRRPTGRRRRAKATQASAMRRASSSWSTLRPRRRTSSAPWASRLSHTNGISSAWQAPSGAAERRAAQREQVHPHVGPMGQLRLGQPDRRDAERVVGEHGRPHVGHGGVGPAAGGRCRAPRPADGPAGTNTSSASALIASASSCPSDGSIRRNIFISSRVVPDQQVDRRGAAHGDPLESAAAAARCRRRPAAAADPRRTACLGQALLGRRAGRRAATTAAPPHRYADLGEELAGHLGGAGRVVDVRRGAALQDRPPEQAVGGRHAEQRPDAHRPGRLAEHRDVGRVAAERRDVVAHPVERRDLVEEAGVARPLEAVGQLLEVQEAEHAEAVVDGDDDDAPRRRAGRRRTTGCSRSR